MRNIDTQFLESFDLARLVIEVYWNHTTGDQGAGSRRVSIENLRRAVERIIKLPIEVLEVDYQSDFLRGNMERYDDRVVVHILVPQTDEWMRFTAVKEFCHALCDKEEERSGDPIPLINGVLSSKVVSSETDAMIRAEHFAEFIALELLYPFEFRRKDKARVKAGECTIQDIAAEFGIPVRYVELAQMDEWLDSCEIFWRFVNREARHERDLGNGQTAG